MLARVLGPEAGRAFGKKGGPPRCLGMENWREREMMSSSGLVRTTGDRTQAFQGFFRELAQAA